MTKTFLMRIGRMRTGTRLASRGWLLAGALALAVTLTKCGSDNETLPTGITGYNHMPRVTGWSIGSFSVNEHSGRNISPEGGGAGSSCCVLLPKKWHSGTRVKVDWSYDVKLSDPRTPPPPQQAEVKIPEYTPETSGDIQVHFYPDHRIKLVVSRYGIEHPRYPMSEEDKKPWVTDRTLEQ
jgi:hypothetical protein